jgi:hypothetical protein
MPRCVHLHESGLQCPGEAVGGSDFCEDHQPFHSFAERLSDHPFRKLIVRLVAFLLLLVLLIPFYQAVKALYRSPLAAVEKPG